MCSDIKQDVKHVVDTFRHCWRPKNINYCLYLDSSAAQTNPNHLCLSLVSVLNQSLIRKKIIGYQNKSKVWRYSPRYRHTTNTSSPLSHTSLSKTTLTTWISHTDVTALFGKYCENFSVLFRFSCYWSATRVDLNWSASDVHSWIGSAAVRRVKSLIQFNICVCVCVCDSD